MKSMGMACGCGCKAVYNFIDFLILLNPTPLVSVPFCCSIPTFCSFLKCFSFLLKLCHNTICGVYTRRKSQFTASALMLR